MTLFELLDKNNVPYSSGIRQLADEYSEEETAPLQARIQELEDVVKVKSEHVKTMIRNGVLWGEEKAELKEENERLREALESCLSFIEEIKDQGITNWSGELEAKEALKGGDNENNI